MAQVVSKFDKFKEITDGMAGLYAKKNKDYGDSFSRSFKEFGLDAPIIRLSDKLQRLKTLSKQEAKVKDESIRDTLIDLANYAIMTVIELDGEKEKEARTFNRANQAQISSGEAKEKKICNCTCKGKRTLKDGSVCLVYVFDGEFGKYRVDKIFRTMTEAHDYVYKMKKDNEDLYHYEVMKVEE